MFRHRLPLQTTRRVRAARSASRGEAETSRSALTPHKRRRLNNLYTIRGCRSGECHSIANDPPDFLLSASSYRRELESRARHGRRAYRQLMQALRVPFTALIADMLLDWFVSARLPL